MRTELLLQGRCPAHPDDVLAAHCDTCAVVTCKTCQLHHHTRHQYTFIDQKTTEMRQKCERWKLEQAPKVERLRNETDVKRQLETAFQSLFTAIDARQTELKREVQERIGEKRRKLEDEKDRLEKLSKLYQQSSAWMEEVLESGATQMWLHHHQTDERHVALCNERATSIETGSNRTERNGTAVSLDLIGGAELESAIRQWGKIERAPSNPTSDSSVPPVSAVPAVPAQQPTGNASFLSSGRESPTSADATQLQRNVKTEPAEFASPPAKNCSLKPVVCKTSPISEPSPTQQQQQQQPSWTGSGREECAICRTGVAREDDNLLIDCDSCGRFFHQNCHLPPLSVLKDNWRCGLCREVIQTSTVIKADPDRMTPSALQMCCKILLRILCIGGIATLETVADDGLRLDVQVIRERVSDGKYAAFGAFLTDLKSVLLVEQNSVSKLGLECLESLMQEYEQFL